MKTTDFHHYKECGLDNIYVSGLKFKDDNGDKVTLIPAIQNLHNEIAKDLIFDAKPIGGKEFYFLRTELWISLKKLSKELKVDSKILKNWEKNNKVSEDIDMNFRLYFLNNKYKELAIDSTWDCKSTCKSLKVIISRKPSKKPSKNDRIEIGYKDKDRSYHSANALDVA